MMRRRQRTTTRTDDNKDFCCDEVIMMIRRRKEKARMAKGTDEDKDIQAHFFWSRGHDEEEEKDNKDGRRQRLDYCDEVTMMKRRTRTRTYIWLPLDDTLFTTPDIITN